eukprot:365763-Chlamydomonas_euryale.AAC.2
MGIDCGDRASFILTAAEIPRQGRPQSWICGSLCDTSARPRRIASLPSYYYIAISRRVEPRCTAAVVEWAINSSTAPRSATPQPKAVPDVQIMDVPKCRNEPAARRLRLQHRLASRSSPKLPSRRGQGHAKGA